MINEKLLKRAHAKGSDTDYQKWIRRWPSILTKTYSEFIDGVGYCEYSHVRRVSFGSGVAEKPLYSGLPLTHEEHALIHQKGESVFYPPEWWEQQAISYLVMWVNGVNPPVAQEQKAHWKQEYIITSAGHLTALQMLLVKYFKNPKSPPVKLTIQRHIQRRSTAQNSAQWGVIYQQLVTFYKNNPVAFGMDMVKSIDFGLDIDSVHSLCKRLFNKGASTAKMSKLQHSEYFQTIQEYYESQYGLAVRPPVDSRGDDSS